MGCADYSMTCQSALQIMKFCSNANFTILKSYLRTFHHHIACFCPRDETIICAPQTKENSRIIFAGK